MPASAPPRPLARVKARPASGTLDQVEGPDEEELRPYIIVTGIGNGSFATVYKGYHEETHHQVAIKAVQRSKIQSAKLLDNLQSEIDILKSLSHRHITKLIDIVRAQNHIYLIMEYCSGGDLSAYIKKRGRVETLEYIPIPGAKMQYYPHPRTGLGLDVIVVRSFLRQLARALKFLRHRDLIHRDIKPQNLLLNPASPEELARGHPLGVPILKVADFGFARSLPNQMMAETLCGSPLYMAPEILRSDKYDAKADLWSVGAVLYEMAVGKPPFRAMNHIELLKKIESSKGIVFPDEDPSRAPPPPADNNQFNYVYNQQQQPQLQQNQQQYPTVPDDIKALIRRLLKRKPAERASFDEFFASEALAKSKFPRPGNGSGSAGGSGRHRAPGMSSRSRTGNTTTGSTGTTLSTNTIGDDNADDATATITTSNKDRGRDRNLSRDTNTSAKAGMEREGKPAHGDEEEGVQDVAQNVPWAGQTPIPEHHRVIPPEVLDPKAMFPPSKFKFRKTHGGGEGTYGIGGSPASPVRPLPTPTSRPSSSSRPASTHGTPPQHPHAQARQQLPRLLSTEGSVIPGETEEDGLLRREYVLVDNTRAVEFNKAVDEISSARRRPLQDRRVPPSPLIMDDVNIPAETNAHSPIPTSATGNTTFPPPPNPNAPPLSSSPTSAASRAASNALSRALSIASKKLFGVTNSNSSSPRPSYHALPHNQNSNGNSSPHNQENGTPSPRRQIIVGKGVEDGDGERDPVEDELLAKLEELAQKTDVLTHWADEMYEYVKAVPQKPLPDPTKFTKRDGEPERHAIRRRNADMEAEYNAVTCVAVYMLLMSFSQKGINQLRDHQEHVKMRNPDGEFIVSEGFDDALTWFREHFIKCNDRAALVKTWLPAQYDGPKSWLDQLVYDRALVLSRTAARKELLDQATTPDECEKLYEESLWCLYALQDDLLQTGNPFLEEDRTTIATWIKRTKLRLVRCRARMSMNDRDRVNDARADLNLADVARHPAPWDVQPLDDPQQHVTAALPTRTRP